MPVAPPGGVWIERQALDACARRAVVAGAIELVVVALAGGEVGVVQALRQGGMQTYQTSPLFLQTTQLSFCCTGWCSRGSCLQADAPSHG